MALPLRDRRRRYNHFPATPACSLVWYFTGEAGCCAHLPARPTIPARPCPADCSPARCQPQPEPARHDLMLMPDAWRFVTGIDPGPTVNRVVSASELMDPAWILP